MESWAAANEEQARYRDGGEAAHWLAYEERYARVLASFAGYLLTAAAIGRVGQVVGVGCGTGSTTWAAGRAAVDGEALDLGLPSAMPRQAARRARPERLGNASFEHGDAPVHRFTPGAGDVALSHCGGDVLRRPGGRVRRHRPRPSPRGPAGLRAPAEPRQQRIDLDRGPRQRGRLHVALPSPVIRPLRDHSRWAIAAGLPPCCTPRCSATSPSSIVASDVWQSIHTAPRPYGRIAGCGRSGGMPSMRPPPCLAFRRSPGSPPRWSSRPAPCPCW